MKRSKTFRTKLSSVLLPPPSLGKRTKPDELGVLGQAGLREVGLRDPDLLEGRLQGGVVEQGDLHRALEGQVLLQERRDPLLDLRAPRGCLAQAVSCARSLGNAPLHVLEGRLGVHARAAGQEPER